MDSYLVRFLHRTSELECYFGYHWSLARSDLQSVVNFRESVAVSSYIEAARMELDKVLIMHA